jgi:hypothetical protein
MNEKYFSQSFYFKIFNKKPSLFLGILMAEFLDDPFFE